MAVRMMADALMANVSLIAALAIRFVLIDVIGDDHAVGTREALWSYVRAFAHNAWLLTPLCLVIFAANGFYTYGRAYQGRYKALVITQAVVVKYLVFAFMTYLVWDGLGLLQLPRMALLLTIALHLGLCLASRSWTFLWEHFVRPEREDQLRTTRERVRNVLVIGGAGYIGSALLPKLLKHGYRVRVLDLFLYGTDPIRDVTHHPHLELVHGDFRQVQTVVQAVRTMEAVVHLGAIVGDPACDLDEQITLDVNLSATQMVAQVAKASGIRRFLFASTCSVYGASEDLLDERSEVRPVSLYGNTKLVAERGLQSMADEHFTPTILRFATIYGLSGRTRFDLVVNLLAAQAKTEGRITIFGGRQWRPFIHVDDAALGLFHVLNAPLALVDGEIFNVGCDEQNYRIGQIGELIQQHAEGAELLAEKTTSDLRNYRVSFRKIRNILGFRPQWTVEDGIRQVMDAVGNGDIQDYRDPRYSNVKYLREAGAMDMIRINEDWSRELDCSESAREITTGGRLARL